MALEPKPERHTEGQLPADRAGHDVIERLLVQVRRQVRKCPRPLMLEAAQPLQMATTSRAGHRRDDPDHAIREDTVRESTDRTDRREGDDGLLHGIPFGKSATVLSSFMVITCDTQKA